MTSVIFISFCRGSITIIIEVEDIATRKEPKVGEMLNIFILRTNSTVLSTYVHWLMMDITNYDCLLC